MGIGDWGLGIGDWGLGYFKLKCSLISCILHYCLTKSGLFFYFLFLWFLTGKV